MILTLLMPAAMLLGAPGQDAAAAAQDRIVVTGEKKKDPNKRVCKRAVPTGSLMPKVNCRTAGEWAYEAERNAMLQNQLKRDQAGREAMNRAAAENAAN
ncbi:MAG: hypothetical protein EOP58_10490 [Sphingomonadales bacterium]|nr:MAG: hypothetical protein EOP58_10490 [Sphingomonadales bacterium]